MPHQQILFRPGAGEKILHGAAPLVAPLDMDQYSDGACGKTKHRRKTGRRAPRNRRMIGKTFAFIAALAICRHAQAQDIGSAQQGLRLARAQCSECHLIDGIGRAPNADAPTFVQIANTAGMTSAALIAALRTSHRTMPNIIIKDSDVGDVVAYILSLRRSR